MVMEACTRGKPGNLLNIGVPSNVDPRLTKGVNNPCQGSGFLNAGVFQGSKDSRTCFPTARRAAIALSRYALSVFIFINLFLHFIFK
jgi:hypothetical protein